MSRSNKMNMQQMSPATGRKIAPVTAPVPMVATKRQMAQPIPNALHLRMDSEPAAPGGTPGF